MKTVSIVGKNGKEYVFSYSGEYEVVLLDTAYNPDKHERIMGYVIYKGSMYPHSWSTGGISQWKIGWDKFRFNLDIKQDETIMTIKEIEEKYGISNLKIKGE